MITLIAGAQLNVAFQVGLGLALSVAAAANFPALLLALTWRRSNTMGAIAGIFAGLVVSVVCIVLGPSVWPGGAEPAPHPIEYPTLVAIPIGFLACWLGTVLSTEHGATRNINELQVRSQAGLGSEQSVLVAQ